MHTYRQYGTLIHMKWTRTDTYFVATIILAISAFFFRLFWPTLQIITTPDFGLSDAVTHLSIKIFYGAQLAQHHIPLWTTYIGGGYPIFALGTMATFFLPNLICFSLFPPVIAYNIVLVFSLCFMGCGMYVWLRCMKYRRIACMFGSITTVLSGYCIVQLTHITIVQSYCIFPWLAALTLSLSHKKSGCTVGWFILLLSQQICLGFPQCVFITLIFLSAYWIWLMHGNIDILQKTLSLFIAILVGCAAAAVQILPSVEYLKTLQTANGYSLYQATYYSYPLQHILTLINPFALGNPAAGTYPQFSKFDGSIFWENTAYIGIIPLICLAANAFIGLWKKRKIKSTIFFIIMLFASFLLMTGRHSPLYIIYSFWPFNIFRVPSRFIWLFTITLILLCVHAFNQLLEYTKKIKFSLLIVFGILCIHTISLYIVWSPYHLLTPAAEWLKNPPLVKNSDAGQNTMSIGAEQLYENIYGPHGWLNLQGATNSSLFLRNTLTPDKSMIWNVSQIADYSGRAIRRSQVFTDLLQQTITSDSSNATVSAAGNNILSLLSITNIISTLPLTQQGLSPEGNISDQANHINLYKNPGALPTVYFAKQAIPVHTVEEAGLIVTSDTFIPGDTALVEFDATLSAAPIRGTVHISLSEQGKYVAEVTNPNKNAILVLTQTYYPGWHASVDTHETAIFPVNIKHIGILVPNGNHTITFWYMPDSFVYGAWISGISLGITMFLMVFGFVWSRRHTL